MRPLEGRRIWFVGIGGAGLSGYAALARAWGAEVGGWDRVETPYLGRLEDVRVELSAAPTVPEGWEEVVVSTAYRGRVQGKTRAEFLAELVSLQRSIVVAGAHGKTTTAAMIAFCLDRLGLEPSFLLGGDVPQLGGNARAGRGWLVVEGDESDRTIAALRPEIGVVTNVDLDHHSEFGSRAEVERLFAQWLASVPNVVRGDELEPVAFELAVPGEHNRRNAATALAGLAAAGVKRADAERVLVEFTGVERRFHERGRVSGIVVVDDYAHHPAEIEGALAAAREAFPHARLLVVFQPHLYSRTRHLAQAFAEALAGADVVSVTDVYPAREQAVDGVTGKLIVDRLAEIRPGMPLGWTPGLEDAARFVCARARAGDTVLTVGAGDVDRVAALVLDHMG